MRVFGKVAYQGSHYQGWQKQSDAPSVEETIEAVLSKILNQDINIFGSGRTDAGVHALNQTFHFDIEKENLDLDKLKYAANSLLPKDVFIKELKVVDNDFHARYSIKEKIYEYRIKFGERDVFNYQNEATIPYPTDIKKMEESLKLFVGQHNYQNFTSKEEDEAGFVREIKEISTVYYKEENRLTITLVGNGFMRYMVRYIIGTALAIGQGKEDLSFITDNLDSKERNIISYKAPAEGLFLKDVKY